MFIRAQDGDETRLSGLPIEVGELYPLLVMENLGRGASPFLVVSMCAQACAAGAIVTTETPELFEELQTLISEVRSNGVVEADIKYGLDKKLARRLKISPPGAVDAPAEPPHRASRKQPSTTPLPTDLPQHTFPEAKVAAMALADGPRLRRWLPVEGELALRHRVSERKPLQTKLLGAPLLDRLGQAHTLEGIEWTRTYGGERRDTPDYSDRRRGRIERRPCPTGDDPFDSTVQLLSALTLHHGYDDHEAFVASWGGELIRHLRLAEGR